MRWTSIVTKSLDGDPLKLIWIDSFISLKSFHILLIHQSQAYFKAKHKSSDHGQTIENSRFFKPGTRYNAL